MVFDRMIAALVVAECARSIHRPTSLKSLSKITSTVEIPIARWEESEGVTKITFPTEHAGVTLEVTAEHVGTDHFRLVVRPTVRQISVLERVGHWNAVATAATV